MYWLRTGTDGDIGHKALCPISHGFGSRVGGSCAPAHATSTDTLSSTQRICSPITRAHGTERDRTAPLRHPFYPARSPAAVSLLHAECFAAPLRCRICPPPPQPRRARLRQPHRQLVALREPPRRAAASHRKISTDRTPDFLG